MGRSQGSRTPSSSRTSSCSSSCRRCSTAAASSPALRELRENVRQISMLAVGLVLATALAVAVVAHAVIDDSRGPPRSSSARSSRPPTPSPRRRSPAALGVPRRVVTIVEGEALINDATALVAYKVAVAAVLTGGFTAWKAGAEFLYSGIGGAAFGLVVGWIIAQVRRAAE